MSDIMRKGWIQSERVLTVIVSIALLVAPLCSAACAASNCYAPAVAQGTEPSEQSHHCHQSPAAQPANQTAPQPERHSHPCADHQAALFFSANDSKAALSGIVLLTPYLPASFITLLAGQTQALHRSWRDSLKSPPHLPQRAILRI